MARAQTEGGHFHAVRFYENDSSLCRIVSSFVSEGLAVNQPALIIATAPHVAGILQNLTAAGDTPRKDARPHSRASFAV